VLKDSDQRCDGQRLLKQLREHYSKPVRSIDPHKSIPPARVKLDKRRISRRKA